MVADVDAHGGTAALRQGRHSDWVRFAWPAGVSLFLAAHGFAHLVGTSRSFQAATDGESLDYLGGAWTISDPFMLRLVGFAWAVVAVAYLAAASGEWLGWQGWLRFAAVVTVFSLVLSILGIWESVIGVVVDVILLTLILWRLAKAPPAGARPS